MIPPDPQARWRLPRLTRGVFADLAVWMVGLGLLTGAVFPVFALALGVSAAEALRARFFAATLAAGLLVGGVKFLLARGVIGVRLRLLGHRTGFVAEMVGYATDTGDWSQCDPVRCSIPVDSDDEIGESARAFNRLIGALARSHAVEAAVRDLLEALSSDLELHALSEAALGRLLRHTGARVGAVLVDVERELQLTAVCGLPEAERLLDAPEVLQALRTRTPRQLEGLRAGGPPLAITPVGFEHRALGCLVLPNAGGGDADRLIALFARAFGVALNNALAHARAERLAALDPLTGVTNRRAGLEALEREVARARRELRTLGVLMIDLDHFKSINDRYGHLTGDRVLAAAAGAIRGVLRNDATVMRYGGEEFLAILPAADPAGLHHAAERIRQALAAVAESGSTIIASVGSATLARDEGMDQLVERADHALYRAKAAGRDRVIAAPPPEPAGLRAPL